MGSEALRVGLRFGVTPVDLGEGPCRPLKRLGAGRSRIRNGLDTKLISPTVVVVWYLGSYQRTIDSQGAEGTFAFLTVVLVVALQNNCRKGLSSRMQHPSVWGGGPGPRQMRAKKNAMSKPLRHARNRTAQQEHRGAHEGKPRVFVLSSTMNLYL